MESSLAHLMSWCETTQGDVPPPLTGPSISISPLPSPHPPTILLFGGKLVQNRRLTSGMWALDLGTRTWERVDAGEGPGPRYFHSMDIWEDKLVCFGGMSDGDPMSVHNDIWFFDCQTRRWLPPPQPGISGTATEQDPDLIPSARYAHLSAVSRGKLVVSGGQHSDNSWIYEINVFDLRRNIWVSKTEQPEMQVLHSKGAYRSVATSSKQRVILPDSVDPKVVPRHSYAVDEEDEGGNIWCYSNYDFAKVRRELDVVSPVQDASAPYSSPAKYRSPPDFSIHELSSRMHGPSQPPGLRFPTGGIVGNHFLLCGLYLASSSAAFSIWALDLERMSWAHLEPAVLSTGSWNRAVIWPEQAKVLIFGNPHYDLAADYGRRAVNLDQMIVVSLEAYGIYPPPKLELPVKAQEVGLSVLDENLSADFEVICDDDRRIKCSRKILSRRWAWFAARETKLAHSASGVMQNAPVLDIVDTLSGCECTFTSTHLTIPEPYPVCIALLQYFYTLSLSTLLQNRAPVLSSLLFFSKQNKIDHLARLVVHALHQRLEPSVAFGIYEIATLSGEQNLQVRALNMIHSSKSSASSRSHRQGPVGAITADSSRVGTPQNQHASSNFFTTSEGSGQTSSSGPRATSEAKYRRAPVEVNLSLDNESIDETGQFGPTGACIPRYTETDERRNPAQLDTAGALSLVSPPINHVHHLGHTSRSTSSDRHRSNDSHTSRSTNTAATSSFPLAPSKSSLGSPVLPLHESISRQRYPASPSTRGLTVSVDDELVKPGTNSLSSRPTSRASQTDTSPPLDMQAKITTPPRSIPPRTASMKRAKTTGVVDKTERLGRVSAFGMSAHHRKDKSHFSISTQFSAESDLSNRSEAKDLPITPISDVFHVNIDSPLTRSATGTSMMDSGSMHSNSTGASSKKTLKMEQKAIRAPEKAALRQESRAKVEAARAEQARNVAIAKAEAQRRAETAAKSPTPVTSVSKSKLGKFGVMFAEAVLFPSAGQQSTMF